MGDYRAGLLRLLLAFAVVATALVGVGLLGLSPAAGGSTGLTLRSCVHQKISGRCGMLMVPLDWARPGGRKIGINVFVIPALQKPVAPEAFAYITGGPGGAATDETGWIASTFLEVNRSHDILLVDQRGTGKSTPLVCPQPFGPHSTVPTYVRACMRSLGASVVTQYGTAAAMDDLDAVRAALGYKHLDVYGVSYGVTAAQMYVKRHPAAVRTLVLDSGSAIDFSFLGHLAANSQHALDQLAEGCSADPSCRRAFPHWRTQFGELVRRWDARPARIGNNQTITGADFAEVVREMLFDANSAASLPLVVSRTAGGDYGLLDKQIILQGPPSPEWPMYWSIWCNEPFVGLDAHGPWHTDFDSDVSIRLLSFFRSVCTGVPKQKSSRSDWAAPRSRVPVLMLAGGSDPQDPVANFPRLKQMFPNSRTIILPQQGHWVARYGCLADLIGRFITLRTTTRLDTRCVSEIRPPAFTLR